MTFIFFQEEGDVFKIIMIFLDSVIRFISFCKKKNVVHAKLFFHFVIFLTNHFFFAIFINNSIQM